MAVIEEDLSMGIFDLFSSKPNPSVGVITEGRNKNTGGHDHRTNKGDDRTPAQKKADKEKRR